MSAEQVFFDLQKALTTNPDFCKRIEDIMQAFIRAEAAGRKADSKKLLTQFLTLCDFNPSLLLPYFFPDFTYGKPMTLWSRPHAFSMMAFIPNGTVTVAASRQIGKCVTGDTELLVRKRGGDKTEMSAKELFDACTTAKRSTMQ